MPVRSPRIAVAVVALGVLAAATSVRGDDCLRPARPGAMGRGATLADLGEAALERLPWDVHIVRANLSARRPVSVTACYLMDEDVLVVGQNGLVYCMARRDLSARWVSSLKAPLAAIPGEGPAHYVFLVKANDGAYWIHAFQKRTGAEVESFPVRLPFAASAGVDADGSRVYVGSLGSPRNNRTVESVSLLDGKRGWGWRTRGLLWAAPLLDPTNTSLVIAGEDGTVTSLPAGALEPTSPNWSVTSTGPIDATPAVTPVHVVVGSQDGLLRCYELATGEVQWLKALGGPIRTTPWVLGQMEKVRRSTGVEGALDVEVEAFRGITLAHNRTGLHAFDLDGGAELFADPAGVKPICKAGRWVVTLDGNRVASFRDAEGGYEVKGRLGLQMFDLIPANAADGAIYACTHDGGLVAAIPAP